MATTATRKATVRERPVVLRDWEVRAVLQGRKTQMRVPVKPQPPAPAYRPEYRDDWSTHGHPPGWCYVDGWAAEPIRSQFRVGDRLWVRETFLVMPELWGINHDLQPVHYAADTDRSEVEDYVAKPSIRMPRWASRIRLEVTGVRVERLASITGDDIEAEGFTSDPTLGNRRAIDTDRRLRESFRETWDKLNAPRGFGWDANPWVWAITFRRIDSTTTEATTDGD